MKRAFFNRITAVEDSSISLLDEHIGVRKSRGGYVQTIATYGGELDKDDLKKALSALAPLFPLILVGYGMGQFKPDPSSAGLPDEPKVYRHNCNFSFVVCDNSTRGEERRRRGAYLMVSDVLELMGGVRFEVPDPEEEGETMFLNSEPFEPTTVELIAKLPNLAAYAVHFNTYIPFTTLDRRPPGTTIEHIVFGLDPLQDPGGKGGLPGVHLK